MEKNIICVDFDDTLHDMHSGWGDGSCYGLPLPGAKEGIEDLVKAGYRIHIYSCRTSEHIHSKMKCEDQARKIQKWLDKYYIHYDEIVVGGGKPYAEMYLDDRGYRFNGWDKVDHVLETLKNGK